MVVAGLVLAGSSVSALAASGPYLGGHFGLVMLDDAKNHSDEGSFIFDFEQGLGGGVTLGFDLDDDYPHIGKGRIEVELGYRQADLDRVEFNEGPFDADGDVTVLNAMLNTIAEYRHGSQWRPYLGLGIGAAQVSLNDATTFGGPLVDDDDLVFAYQVLAGLGLKLSKTLTWDIGYRWLSSTDPELVDGLGEEFDFDFSSHQLSLGLRFSF